MARMIHLADLLSGLVSLEQQQNVLVQNLSQDSRKVTADTLFLAFPGLRSDGRDFIATAVASGASAVLYETTGAFQPPSLDKIPLIGIQNLNAKAGMIASRFFGEPTQKMTLIGVTGTNGKTSISQFVAQALSLRGRKCAVIGTLGKGFLPDLQSTGYTTPDAIGLQQDLAECLAQGADSVSMEVSSHSLSQHRVAGVKFDIAVFTNLTRDHLDYHGDMAAYGAEKAKLFQMPTLKYAIYNADDPFGLQLISQNPARVQAVAYSLQPQKNIHCPMIMAREITPTAQGFHLQLQTPWGQGGLNTQLLGHFNLSNLLAVIGVLVSLEIPFEACLQLVEQLQPVCGRMQRFGGQNGFPKIIVDYAHTPDALLQVLKALRAHQPEKLWCVFGCGGDRDRGKRPQMGSIAAEFSDVIVLTNDNPRSEDPKNIAAEIQAGIAENAPLKIELDRTKAIEYAIRSAGSDDIILIAGKGHENQQIIGDKIYPYSDILTVQKILKGIL